MPYIDKDALIKAVENLHDCYNGFSDTYDKACFIGLIEEQPTADVVERKRGKWFFSDTDFLTHCSSCGQSEWKGYCPTPKEATEWMPICPKCGADMRGDNDAHDL